jgi:hypothetical protein
MTALVAGVLLLPKVYDDDTVSPGWLGLVVFLALAVATFFLLRSMFRHLRKVPKTFDEPDPGQPADAPRPGGDVPPAQR